MNIAARFVTITSASLLMISGAGYAKDEAAKKPSPAPETPVTAGYEAAIAAHATKPIFRPSGTAPAVWGPGDLYSFLVTGKESNNALFQFEAVVPPNGGPPPHVHTREDETFYIVSGRLDITLGDSTYHAKAGDFVYIPRGTVHRFVNVGNETAVQLVTFAPAGVEKFFEEVFPPAKDRNVTPPPVTEELIRKMNEAAPKYGLKFTKPAATGKP